MLCFNCGLNESLDLFKQLAGYNYLTRLETRTKEFNWTASH